MNIDSWRSLNYFFQDIIVLQLFLAVGFASSNFNHISKKLKPIYFYLFGNATFEIISKAILKINDKSIFFSYVDYFFVTFEVACLYWFFFRIQNGGKKIRFGILICIILIGFFLIIGFYNPNTTSEHFSIFSSFVNLIFLLFNVFLLSRKSLASSGLQIPEIQVCVSFILAYSVLIAVFFILPFAISYSRILANQILIFKHIVAILFFLIIAYAINKSKRLG